MHAADMTTFQISEAFKANRDNGLPNIAVIPFGSIEQHGPLLPLNTDCVIAQAVARELDAREEGRLFVYPCFQYTNAESGMAFAGGLSTSHDSVRKIVKDICHALIRRQYDMILLLDGHSPNKNDLAEVSFQIVSESFQANEPIPVIILSLEQFYGKVAEKFDLEIGRHGDWFEAFLFRQSGGILPEGDQKAKDPFPSKISHIPGIIGIPVQYRSVCGVIGKIGDGSDMPGRGEEIWQFLITSVHESLKASVFEFYKHFRPTE
jgi:creatinine amidohydrolase/Fe(II)-dependent formamide hydrolase-like protein